MTIFGTVKFWDDNKGYGFIHEDGTDDDYVFYLRGLVNQIYKVKKGDDVMFDISEGSVTGKGYKIVAFNVKRYYDKRTGTIKWYKEGFGYIIDDETKVEYSFHSKKLVDYLNVHEGDRVEFEPCDPPRLIVEGVVRLLKPS
jgi:cold shock protein